MHMMELALKAETLFFYELRPAFRAQTRVLEQRLKLITPSLQINLRSRFI